MADTRMEALLSRVRHVLAAPTEHQRRWRHILTVLLLWLGAFALYLPSAEYDYIYYDDVRILARHPELYHQPQFLDGLKAIVLEQFPREEPLLVRDISWALDSRIFGFPNPHGFHYVNVLLHACVVVLLFLFLLAATRRYAVALLTAVCFVSLAIHVEPVAWVMGRKDLLASAFGFLALLAHSRGIDAGTRGRRGLWYAGSLAFLALALFSKIGTVVLPGLLFLLAVFQPAMREPAVARAAFPWRRILPALLGVLPHLLLSLSVCRWYFGVLTQYGILDRGYTAGPLQHLCNLLLINPMVFVRYLQLLFLPNGLSLFYNWPSLALPFSAGQVALSGAVILLATAGGILLLVKRRDLVFYGLGFPMLMIPFLNLKFIGIWVANRYLYFPAFCLLAGVVTLALDGVRRRPRILGPAMVALLLVFCVGNGYQQRRYLAVWRDSETLWSYELQRPDAAVDVYGNLASRRYMAAIQQSDPAARERGLRQAQEVTARARAAYTGPTGALSPRMYRVIFIDALIAIVRGEPTARQLAALQEVERLNPNYDEVLWQLMVFHYRQAWVATEDAVRREQARLALDYYARDLKVEYRDAEFAAKDRAVRQGFAQDFPFLKPELEKLP